MAGTTVEIWTFRAGLLDTGDIDGYSIHAIDGDIGKVDKHNSETGSSYLLVSTGPWILGKTVMLPAGVIERIDHEDKTVYVNRTKDQIKDAPEYDEARQADKKYRSALGDYYAGFGGL